MGGRPARFCAAIVAMVSALVAAYLIVVAAPSSSSGAADADFAAEQTSAANAFSSDDDRVPPGKLPTLGVQFHGTWSHYTDVQRNNVLDKLQDSGATWVRLDVSWAMIQPTPAPPKAGTWGVNLVDKVVNDLRDHNLKVLVMFWLTPDWATSSRGERSEYRAPDDPADYAKAASWAADRWGDEVDAWEVWNEPNLQAFFAGTDGREYAKLMCAAYPAFKQNDPSSQVVFGGLMFADEKFLEDAYRGGAKGCFDVMAIHSYQAPSDEPPTLINTGEYWNLVHLRAIRDTMLAHDDPHPIWITEFGWSVHDNDGDPEEWQRGVTEEQQAEYGTEFLELMAKDFPYVKAAFWYKDMQNPESSDEHQEGFAMIRDDGSTRPVYTAFQHLYGVDDAGRG